MRNWMAFKSVLILCSAALAGEESAPPQMTVPKLAHAAPKIDGVIDEAEWKDAAKSENFRRSFGAESDTVCNFRALRDEQTLYLAIECVETEAVIKSLKAVVDKHDGDPIWDDDEIEIFIDPAGTKKFPYYQIIINTKGTTFDVQMRGMKNPDKSWEPKYEAKVHIGKDRWSVELALPFAMFDRTEKIADTWFFNAAHVRSVGEILYWSSVNANESHSPWRFGMLKMK